MSCVQIWISPFLLGVVSAIVYTEDRHGTYHEPYKGPPGFQRVSGGVVAPYSNENRQLAVNLAALSVGSGTGTGLFYGVPGTGLHFDGPRGHGAPAYGVEEKGYKRSYRAGGGGHYDYKQGAHASGGGVGYHGYGVRAPAPAKPTAVHHERREYHHGTYDGGKDSYGGETKPGYGGHDYKKYSYENKKYVHGGSNYVRPTYTYKPKPQIGYHGAAPTSGYGYKKHYGYQKYEHKGSYGGSYRGPDTPYYHPIYTKAHLFY